MAAVVRGSYRWASGSPALRQARVNQCSAGLFRRRENNLNLRIAPGRRLSTQSLPTIFQRSFWRSILPKAFRGESAKESGEVQTQKKTKEWNPATFFIIIFMLIGSQAIQMISLQRDFDLFSHKTEVKLGKLREVVRRIRAGEEVDVKGMLGTGDEVQEREWEEVIRELEEEETRLAYLRKAKRATAKMEEMSKASGNGDGDASPKAVAST